MLHMSLPKASKYTILNFDKWISLLYYIGILHCSFEFFEKSHMFWKHFPCRVFLTIENYFSITVSYPSS